MKILWITNITFPEAISLLQDKEPQSSLGGGWMIGSANSISTEKTVDLYIASLCSLVSELKFVTGERYNYCLIPWGKGNEDYNKDYEEYWRIIKERIEPDVIHIHGTEFPHGLAYVRACGSQHVVVSIQGLVSVYARYIYKGSPLQYKWHIPTLYDVTRFGDIRRERSVYEKRGKYEIELLQSVQHIIGRTSWDEENVWAINPKAKYHFCNETLRSEFYENYKWNYDNCNSHQIFTVATWSIVKGFHQLLMALPLILRFFPDTVLHVAGQNPAKVNGVKDYIFYSGYRKQLKHIIKENKLREHVIFKGRLSASEMRAEYLQSNVFVSPSVIENSPNALGEAQILGVPCVASYVGGVMDMMKGNEDNLYRYEEIEMLAFKVCKVFRNKENQIDMSPIANKRHNRETNKLDLLKIYHNIISN